MQITQSCKVGDGGAGGACGTKTGASDVDGIDCLEADGSKVPGAALPRAIASLWP